MTAGQELTYYLGELRNSNLLSSGRAVSDVLRASADNAELIDFISAHAHDVSLETELRAFASTRSMPEDPRVCLPFAYALLYLLDSDKLSAEDLTSTLYPGTDAFDSYPVFFTVLTDAIESSIAKADSVQSVTDTETPENETDTTEEETEE